MDLRELAALVGASKRLLARPHWDSISDRRYHVFTAPLALDQSSISGFEMRAKVSKQFVDRDATAQLEYSRSGRDRTELIRCDWRPLGVHRNRAWGPPGFQLWTFDRTSHLHAFEDNYIAKEGRMRAGSLPAALPISPEPTSLSAFFAFCGNRFNIGNIEVLEMPSISPDMFWVQK